MIMQGTHQDMHREHQDWANEAALWREEVELWRGQLGKAMVGLERLDLELRQHSNLLASHLGNVDALVEQSRQHEHALAEFERRGFGDELLHLAKKHRSEASAHNEQREAHEQIKQQHHAAMAKLAHTLEELSQTTTK